MQTLATLRTKTTKALAGVELPDAFACATAAAAANACERKSVSARVSRRRLLSKVARLEQKG
jgi:hypothetical protein